MLNSLLYKLFIRGLGLMLCIILKKNSDKDGNWEYSWLDNCSDRSEYGTCEKENITHWKGWECFLGIMRAIQGFLPSLICRSGGSESGIKNKDMSALWLFQKGAGWQHITFQSCSPPATALGPLLVLKRHLEDDTWSSQRDATMLAIHGGKKRLGRLWAKP
jgi:hypothetical protein